MDIIQRLKDWWYGVELGGMARSSQWQNFRNQFLKRHPLCEACGVKAETAHHCIPFHIAPEKELFEENIVALCDECHLVLAHLKSFKRWDKDIRETTKVFRERIKNFSI